MAWDHLVEAIAFAVYTISALYVQRRQQNSFQQRLPEIITDSLRPPPAPTTIEFVCEHSDIQRIISGRGMSWCAKCGALKIDGGPWRESGAR